MGGLEGAAETDRGPGQMEYRLLGPVEAIRDGVSVDLTARQRALLALLLVHADEVVSSDRIIEELWRPSTPRGR